ncbi:MAG: hypothetical protein KGN39_00690 [Betaproteobacteria bacterium]|nr:hypothetical protein [Betaproteobacteria bacterium]
MRRPILFIALTAALSMTGCGAKGPLVLPPPQVNNPTKPQTSAPRPAQTAPVQDDVSTPPTPTR